MLSGHDAARSETCVKRYLFPEPRTRVGLLLGRNRAATACVDLSDGLADAVRRIAEASGVGAAIEASAVPVDPDASKWFSGHGSEPLAAAMTGGDDYEVLAAVYRSERAATGRGQRGTPSRAGATPTRTRKVTASTATSRISRPYCLP